MMNLALGRPFVGSRASATMRLAADGGGRNARSTAGGHLLQNGRSDCPRIRGAFRIVQKLNKSLTPRFVRINRKLN